MRWVKHRDTDNKRLFPYNELASYNDCDELIICLSERSLNIILNALRKSEEMRTRVWTTRQGDLYQIASDEEFEQFRVWTSDLFNQLGSWVMCNELLERIAVALEAANEAKEHEVLDLFDLLEAFGIEPSESEADILEALQYLFDLPGINLLPDFKIPKLGFIQSYLQGRVQSAQLQLLRDISISQRAQAVAQGGVDFAGLYDTMGETADSLLVKAGFLGKAYWLWRWIDNDQIPGWLGWLTSLSSLVFGSIRDATYGVEQAVRDLATDVTQAIGEQTNQTIVNCNNCSSSAMYDIINDDDTQDPYAVVEDDSGWTVPEEPPISDDTTWGVSEIEDYKCQAANYIVGWLIGFYGSDEWDTLTEDDNTITISEKISIILAQIPPIGVTLNALSVIIGRMLRYLSSGDDDFLTTVNEVIVDLQSELICAIYQAEGPDEARDAFEQILIDDGRLDGLKRFFLTTFLQINNVMALAFYTNPEVEPHIAEFGTDCDCGEECEPLTSGIDMEFGTAEHLGDGVWEFTGGFASGWGCGASAREIAFGLLGTGFFVSSYEVVSGSITSCSGFITHHVFEGLTEMYEAPEGAGETIATGQRLGSLYILSSTDFVVRMTLCE